MPELRDAKQHCILLMETYTCSKSLKTCKKNGKNQIQGQWLPLGQRRGINVIADSFTYIGISVMCTYVFALFPECFL